MHAFIDAVHSTQSIKLGAFDQPVGQTASTESTWSAVAHHDKGAPSQAPGAASLHQPQSLLDIGRQRLTAQQTPVRPSIYIHPSSKMLESFHSRCPPSVYNYLMILDTAGVCSQQMQTRPEKRAQVAAQHM